MFCLSLDQFKLLTTCFNLKLKKDATEMKILSQRKEATITKINVKEPNCSVNTAEKQWGNTCKIYFSLFTECQYTAAKNNKPDMLVEIAKTEKNWIMDVVTLT